MLEISVSAKVLLSLIVSYFTNAEKRGGQSKVEFVRGKDTFLMKLVNKTAEKNHELLTRVHLRTRTCIGS
jgi:hypothetical protein